MKRLLSLSLALVSLFSVTAASAQNPKISNPDKANVRISQVFANGSYTICVEFARVTGLGNASSVTASLTAEGTADVTCTNRGQDEGPIPGQSFSTTGGSQTLTASNGVLEVAGVCVTISGSCKGKALTSSVSNVNITNLFLTLNGKRVSLTEFINQ